MTLRTSRVATPVAYAVPMILALLPTIARADGGAVRAVEQHGAYQVAVFTSPVPLVVGPTDVSVLVQDAGTLRVVEDAEVSVTVFPVERPQERIAVKATRAAATNKLFQAALVDLPTPGAWRARVECQVSGESMGTTFDFHVGAARAASPRYWRWVAWPWAVVAMFVAHQWLAARQGRHRPRPRRHEQRLSN